MTPVNDAPIVAAPTADQRIDEDTPWSFQVPAGAFKDVEGDNLTYTATLANGSPLPAWLGSMPDPHLLGHPASGFQWFRGAEGYGQ